MQFGIYRANPELLEVDIETGEVIFEWYSLDHVDPKCGLRPNSDLVKFMAYDKNRQFIPLG